MEKTNLIFIFIKKINVKNNLHIFMLYIFKAYRYRYLPSKLSKEYKIII